MASLGLIPGSQRVAAKLGMPSVAGSSVRQLHLSAKHPFVMPKICSDLEHLLN